MTFDAVNKLLMTSTLIIGLIACGGESYRKSGILVHIGETHSEARPGVEVQTPSLFPSSPHVRGGYDQTNLEKHPLVDVNGRVVSVYGAYLVIDDVELIQCPTITRFTRDLLNGIIPSAYAHAGHGSEPIGDRSLDKPNVINIVTQEGFILPLGSLPIAPGQYCSLSVSIARLLDDAYGLPEFKEPSDDDPISDPGSPDMAGLVFAIQADYCDEITDLGQCGFRQRVDITDAGVEAPEPVKVEFDRPLRLDGNLREGYVVIGIAYGEWLRNVDITQLNGNASELKKLLDNIAASIHINDSNLGDLPPNIL